MVGKTAVERKGVAGVRASCTQRLSSEADGAEKGGDSSGEVGAARGEGVGEERYILRVPETGMSRVDPRLEGIRRGPASSDESGGGWSQDVESVRVQLTGAAGSVVRGTSWDHVVQGASENGGDPEGMLGRGDTEESQARRERESNAELGQNGEKSEPLKGGAEGGGACKGAESDPKSVPCRVEKA